MSTDRTLVVAPNWVGDLVMAEPVFRALAASGRSIVTLVRPPLRPLAELLPGVEATVERADDALTVERIRASDCRESVVLPNSLRAAKVVWQARVGRRYGYRGDFRAPLLAPAIRRPRRRRPQVEDYRELLAAMEVDAPDDWVPRLGLPEALRAAGLERLARARVQVGPAPVLGLFPGAEWGPSKRWPRERFVELSNELRRRRPGWRQIVVAGPKEVWLAVRTHEDTGHVHPVIGPDLDLARLAGVLSHLDLLVTNDSGPMHLAAALGVRCVALFGPTDPRRTAPTGEGHRVLYRDLWCSPCFRRRCPLLHHRCLRGIEAEEVADAVEAMVGVGRPLRSAAPPHTLGAYEREDDG